MRFLHFVNNYRKGTKNRTLNALFEPKFRAKSLPGQMYFAINGAIRPNPPRGGHTPLPVVKVGISWYNLQIILHKTSYGK